MDGASMTFGIVSNATIAGIIFSFFLSVSVPILLMLYFWRKRKAGIGSFFIGAVTFLVFAMVLEQGLHTLVRTMFGNVITQNIVAYAIYGGIAAAAFEETGRFISMKIFMKRSLNPDNALMYGVGHGGFEAMLLVGFTEISNLISAYMINAGQMYDVLAGLDDITKAATYHQLTALWETSSDIFFAAGIERLSTIAIHMALSFFVYMGIAYSKNVAILAAYALHFFVDAGSIILSQYIANTWIVEGYILVLAAVLGILAYIFYKMCRAENPEVSIREQEEIKLSNLGKRN